jgi:hypothetical protein
MNSETPSSSSLKSFIKSIPVVGPTAAKLSQLAVFARARSLTFQGSGSFWEDVYREGGTSGPGSYGRLAAFKAEILNDFVKKKNIQTVIEFGCGDGAQLGLANYPQYVGVDIASSSIKRCSALFANDSTKRFYVADNLPKDLGALDLALSLDVIYHLVEDSVFEAYMRRLFDVSRRYVVIYSSNHDNTLTRATHVRHRKFTTWIDENTPGWRTDGVIPNRFPFDPKQPEETSHADFYIYARQNS